MPFETMFTTCTIMMSSMVIVGAHNPRLPNPNITYGVTNTALTKEVICSPEFRTKAYRHVSKKMHEQVWRDYGMDWDKDHTCCEDDHLIPLELGGSNDNQNRWPQPWTDAHEKDKVENELHKLVCEDALSLEEAQEFIREDWRTAIPKGKP